MFGNTIKTAVRNLLKNKGFTFLNVFGLTLGLSIGLLIVLYVRDEWSYDRHNDKADRIYRVNSDTKFGPAASFRAITAPGIAGSLAGNFPEVEKTARLLRYSDRIKKGNEVVLEDRMAYCDPGIFSIFTLPMTAGDPKTALAEPGSVVITESAAKKYFESVRVVGQTLAFVGDSNRSILHKITGVIRDIPAQSHFHFDILLSMLDLKISYNNDLGALFPFSTYLLLKPGADYKKLEAKFPAFMRKSLGKQQWDMDAMDKGGDYYRINLIPLKDIHLQSNRTDELGRNGNIQYVRIFSATALFILLIACINFMNLSTARSADRAREVGVRKVLGSSRRSLIIQFLSESMIVTCVAAVLAVLSAWALLPFFNQLSGKDLSISMGVLAWLLPFLAAVILIVGLLAGSYPAFFLSAFKPARVLKGKLAAGFKGGGLRSFLVVLQFSISVSLIIGTIVIYNQLHFIQSKDLGFNRDQVLILKNLSSLDDGRARILKQEVKELPGVLSATRSSFLPTGSRRWTNYIASNNNSLETQFWPVDEDYVSTMGMSVVRGRDFSNQSPTDSSAMIINETAAKMLGFSKDPLNQKITKGDIPTRYRVIGVVKDFNFSSLRENVTPVVMMLMTPFIKGYEGDGGDNLCIRVNTGNLPALLSRVEDIWKVQASQQHFDYSFMDEDFDTLYRDEQRMGQLFLGFTTLAILIACLGLFGLAAYAAEQRKKEISIRKVLGAGVSALVGILSKDFLKLVGLAILISSPIAWFIMHKWLQDFAYRVDIGWWVLVVAGAVAVVIAAVTISFQSIKAAGANPVESLRSE